MISALALALICALALTTGSAIAGCTRGLELGLGEGDTATDTATGGIDAAAPDGGDDDSDTGGVDTDADGAIGDGGAD